MAQVSKKSGYTQINDDWKKKVVVHQSMMIEKSMVPYLTDLIQIEY